VDLASKSSESLLASDSFGTADPEIGWWGHLIAKPAWQGHEQRGSTWNLRSGSRSESTRVGCPAAGCRSCRQESLAVTAWAPLLEVAAGGCTDEGGWAGHFKAVVDDAAAAAAAFRPKFKDLFYDDWKCWT
jgi:hypothetical protein